VDRAQRSTENDFALQPVATTRRAEFNQQQIDPIEAAARAALKPRDLRPPWRWIEDNVRIRNSPKGNRPDFSRTPWLKEPSEIFADNHRKLITLQCCVQGSKTFFLLTHAIWSLCEAPGPIGYYVPTNEFVKPVADDRWLPMIEETEAIQPLLRASRHSLGKCKISFKHTFSLILAANRSNVQGHSLRYVFCDDVFVWQPMSLLPEAHKRSTAWWNKRNVNGSTGGEAGSELDACFRAGDQREWELACPHCGGHQAIDFVDLEKHLRFPTNETTKPAGQWDFEAVKNAARLVCEHCAAPIQQSEETSRVMNERGRYRVTHPGAPRDTVSFRWNSLCLPPSEYSWGDLAVDWIKAARAWKGGYHEPMRELMTKRGALSWDPKRLNPYANAPVIEISARDTAALRAQKKFWSMQDCILLAADVQIDHFWVLVMAWSARGDECAVFAKQVHNWSEIRELQTEYGVLDEDVMIDWSHRPAEVVRKCSEHGHVVKDANGRPRWISWNALRGSDDFVFIWKNQKTGQKIPLPYKWPPQTGDPSIGLHADDPRRKELLAPIELADGRKGWLKKQCPIITWLNPPIKDIVSARRDGRVKDVKVETLKGDWNKEYFRQMHAWKKEHVQAQYGMARWRYVNVHADDHYADCRCMCTWRAINRGLIIDVAAEVQFEAV
jgi:phage terminase large subunit GpA